MYKGRISTIAFLLLVLCASSAAQLGISPALNPGDTFSVLVTPVNDRIEIDQWAEFSITVRNHQMYRRQMRYTLIEEGVEFSSLTQPSVDVLSGFTIEGQSLHQTIYLLKPNFIPPLYSNRPYYVQLEIEDVDSGETKTVSLPVWIYPKGHFALQRINLTADLTAPERIDPRNTYAFGVLLRNRNDYDIGEVAVQLDGPGISESMQTILHPNEQKTLDFAVELDPQQPPEQGTLTVRVLREGVSIAADSQTMEIVSYRIPFEKTVRQTYRLLKWTTEITFTNMENVPKEGTVDVDTGNVVRRMFSTVEPEGILVMTEEGPQYQYTRTLQPEEQLTVTIVVNYRLPVLVLLALLGITLFWQLSKDPVRVLKYAEQYRMDEGGILELKVVLSVKNLTRKALRAVQVVDKVPSLVHAKAGESFGTLEPSKIVHRKDESMLRWDIDHMDPDEERIVTYVLRAKFPVVGELRLPPAAATVKVDKEKITILSNEADVTSKRQVRDKRG